MREHLGHDTMDGWEYGFMYVWFAIPYETRGRYAENFGLIMF